MGVAPRDGEAYEAPAYHQDVRSVSLRRHDPEQVLTVGDPLSPSQPTGLP